MSVTIYNILLKRTWLRETERQRTVDIKTKRQKNNVNEAKNEKNI